VLIRPRGGDFLYSEDELAVIAHDIATAKALGAAGVVLGLLGADGTVDRDRTGRLIDAARPMSVTFHKAFDEVREPERALEDLIALGVDRILTSGRASTALEGRQRLGVLHRRAAGRLILMAGGRVTGPDLPALIAAGLSEVHVGSAARSGNRIDAGKVRRLV